ncbi:MAG: hypothetical protein CL920_18150 [Deltaproteobacteria bacterium]|nr:hypothetical protein [Deltaproteobacteria bacterium]|tara:strand:- start:797 stop:1678 length:882 start_codon:yes stop_codon:yes gene_type:complete
MEHIGYAFSEGLRHTTRHIKMWFLYWFLNLVAALAVVAPLFFLLQQSLGKSLYAEELQKQFQLQYVFELVYAQQGAPALYVFALLSVAAVYLFLQIFLSGGVLYLFNHEDVKFSFAEFFHGAGRYFWRFFRFFIISLLMYGLYFFLYRKFAGILNGYVKGSIDEPSVVMMSWLKFGLFMLGFWGLHTYLTYVKVGLVAEDNPGVFRQLWRSFRVVVSNLFAVFTLALGLLALGGVLYGLYYLGTFWLSPGKTMLLWLFLIQQIYILLRVWLQLNTQAAQLTLYKELKSDALLS